MSGVKLPGEPIYTYETKTGTRETDRTRYRVIFRDQNGRQSSKRGFKTKRDARDYLRHLANAKDRDEYVKPRAGKTTIAELAGPWLDRKKANLKTSSYQPLESAWKHHVAPKWGDWTVKRVQPLDVEQWVADLQTGSRPLSPTMVIRCHGVLLGVLDDAVKARRLVRNPAKGVPLPSKQPKPKVYLTHEQVWELARTSGRAGLVLTLAYTGIRWSEAAGLQVKHVQLSRGRLTIERQLNVMGNDIWETTPKNGRARSVPFPKFLRSYFEGLCAGKGPDDLVFTEESGAVLQRSHHKAGWFEHAVKAAGVPRVTPHDLRHSAASFAVGVGANVLVVQRMLGHTSAAMTLDTYAELFDGHLDEVSEALDQAVTRRE